MSAFIVENKTINRIVNWLVLEIVHNPESYRLKEKLSKLGYDVSDRAFAGKLAKDMFALNVSAVNQRYNEENPNARFSYIPESPVSLIQTLKSMHCWIYQCTEGNVSESRLYKFFTGVLEKYVLRKIVYGLPEYSKAKWA